MSRVRKRRRRTAGYKTGASGNLDTKNLVLLSGKAHGGYTATDNETADCRLGLRTGEAVEGETTLDPYCLDCSKEEGKKRTIR